MEAIIAPVSVELLEAELTPDKLLRKTNKSNNEIYVITHHDSPNVMREIGRLREVSFRTSGGGSGLGCDVDIYDTMEVPYKQLIVWNPDDREIIGGYRFLHGADVTYDENGVPMLTSSHLFKYSEKFLKEYLPYTIELGRSFVRPEYQSTKMGAKSLFALDNLWDGLGALTVLYPEMKYFFGKVTMYPSYCSQCRNMILYFLNKHFPDADKLVRPISALNTDMDVAAMEQLFV
ncbi:MAG: GNAT family N-acetyltransferase, partial [Paludibacteraceae bacterium]|nr:GNAT family N-acetyltransferase [Paludibacteraceae bacterium]